MKLKSVLDGLPDHKPDKPYIVMTEEGAIHLLRYAPGTNADSSDWWGDMNDSGYIIAWAEMPDWGKDFNALYKRWRESRGEQ